MNNNKKIVYGVVALVILIALFMWLKPAKAPTTMEEGTQASTVAPQTKTFDLTVKNGKIVGASNVLTVGVGDRVTIKVTADVTDTLHLHGYDLTTDLIADKLGGIIFTANTTGQFIFELEKAKIELGTLEVLPR
jgi:heme/copper-type cytochrome/quinol oxidase subunit 2